MIESVGDRRQIGGGAQQVAGARIEGRLPQPHEARLDWVATVGLASGTESTAPRATSMSVSSCRATAWPCEAISRSRPMVTMRRTWALAPLSASVTRSPTHTRPELTVPASPRKSSPSRSTICTGMRNGPVGVVSRAGSRSRCSSRDGPVYQGMVSDAARDVVAGDRGYGNGDRLAEAEAQGELAEVGLDRAKALLRPVDEVHLVDGEDDALHADDVEDRRVAPRLPLHAVAGVDQHDGDVGVRGAARHVARVLLVAWAVDDDEAARLGVEVAPGDVDGDALLALGDEAVDEQAEIGMRAAAGGAAGALQRLALVVVEVGGIPQQPADQRRLAVVDRSAGQQMQDAVELMGGLGRRLGAADGSERRHQK